MHVDRPEVPGWRHSFYVLRRKKTLRSYVAKEDSEVHVMFENSLLESDNRQKKRNVWTTLASSAVLHQHPSQAASGENVTVRAASPATRRRGRSIRPVPA